MDILSRWRYPQWQSKLAPQSFGVCRCMAVTRKSHTYLCNHSWTTVMMIRGLYLHGWIRCKSENIVVFWTYGYKIAIARHWRNMGLPNHVSSMLLYVKRLLMRELPSVSYPWLLNRGRLPSTFLQPNFKAQYGLLKYRNIFNLQVYYKGECHFSPKDRT